MPEEPPELFMLTGRDFRPGNLLQKTLTFNLFEGVPHAQNYPRVVYVTTKPKLSVMTFSKVHTPRPARPLKCLVLYILQSIHKVKRNFRKYVKKLIL